MSDIEYKEEHSDIELSDEELFEDVTEADLAEEEYVNLEDNIDGVNLSNFTGLKFPTEAYQLCTVPQRYASTPAVTPSNSPEKKKNSRKVRDLAAFFEDS